MRIRKILTSVFATAVMLTGVSGVSAQLPESTDVQSQAAAMTLTTEDLPTGFHLTGETFLTPPDASVVPGVTAHYVSVYTNVDSGQQIRSYVYLFEDAAQATDGIQVIEGNEDSNALTDSQVEVGEGDAELSLGTYETSDGSVVGTADVTFVRGTAVAGVAVDNPDGSEPDSQLATDLATSQDTRVQQVQDGEIEIDLTVTEQTLSLNESGILVQAGFLSPNESEEIYGTQGSALTSLQTSWVQSVAYGDEGAAPRVTIAITTFGSAEEAEEVVTSAGGIFQPLADQEEVEDASVDGADSVVAYRYTSRDGATAQQESYRIIFSQDEKVTVVDVQGTADSETAAAAANSVASSQATCQTDGACEMPALPGVTPSE